MPKSPNPHLKSIATVLGKRLETVRGWYTRRKLDPALRENFDLYCEACYKKPLRKDSK